MKLFYFLPKKLKQRKPEGRIIIMKIKLPASLWCITISQRGFFICQGRLWSFELCQVVLLVKTKSLAVSCVYFAMYKELLLVLCYLSFIFLPSIWHLVCEVLFRKEPFRSRRCIPHAGLTLCLLLTPFWELATGSGSSSYLLTHKSFTSQNTQVAIWGFTLCGLSLQKLVLVLILEAGSLNYWDGKRQ